MTEPSVKRLCLNLCIDVVVLANAAVILFEVDAEGAGEETFALLRYGFCGAYLLEMLVKVAVWRRDFLCQFMSLSELAIVLVASGVAFAPVSAEMRPLWRVTVLRLVRYLRVWRLAATKASLRDLWLVLVGAARAAKAICWLLGILLLMVYSCAGAATGMSMLSQAHQAGECSEEMYASGECLDKDLYFGSIIRSSLTLFQCITLDGWAGKVVRPLWGTNPLTASSLTVFAVAMAYGLISVAVGVLVWSTIDLARNHQSHASQVEIARDFDIIRVLRGYFDKTLHLDGRTSIGKREFQEATSVTVVQRALAKLDLPVTDYEELFQHLDRDRCGEILPEEFQARLETMKRPANRFDIACLTASIGGSVTYVTRMEQRSKVLLDDLHTLKVGMRRSFSELHALTKTDADSVPEVVLRKAGRIYNPVPPGPPRFTR